MTKLRGKIRMKRQLYCFLVLGLSVFLIWISRETVRASSAPENF